MKQSANSFTYVIFLNIVRLFTLIFNKSALCETLEAHTKKSLILQTLHPPQLSYVLR